MKLAFPTPGELAEIERFVNGLEGKYELRLTITPASPWLIFNTRLWAWEGNPGTQPPRDRTFGMWRRTLAIYEEGEDGAMGEDALQEPVWYIEVTDGPEFNTRWHRHTDPTCQARYLTPLDDCPPPREGEDDECAHCAAVVPVKYMGVVGDPTRQ
jgi:hypothetical protein